MGVSGCERFLRSVMSAELIAMRVSQVENLALPSKVFRCTKAFNHTS
jgi:hypothetical protein